MEKGIKVKRIIRGRIYEREISDLSRIESNETKTMIGITLRHLYHLVKLGRLHPIKQKGRLAFKYRDVERFLNERKGVK